MKITALREEWIDGIISDGTAGAMMSYNVRGEGEEITIRDCHSYFIPVGGRQQHNDQDQAQNPAKPTVNEGA